MNIEELEQIKEDLKAVYNVMYNFDDVLCDDMQERVKRIETLLTAYEKEKGENVKLRLQDIPLIEGELKAYKDRVKELKAELEKEKEKNKILLQCLKDSQERCENEHLFLGNPDM